MDVLLVDDEELARVALRSLLRERDDVAVVREADSVDAAVAALAEPPDVVFLDVRLVDESGFDLFVRTDVRVPVVFVTAHADHAVRAFAVDAVDYLVKPVLREHLSRALARIQRHRAEAGASQERVSLRAGKNVFFARADEIRFLRADGDYSEVVLADGRQVRVKESLESWQSRLPPSFVRIHRSLVANLDAAEGLVSADGRWELRLRGVRGPLPVSRRLVAALRRRLR